MFLQKVTNIHLWFKCFLAILKLFSLNLPGIKIFLFVLQIWPLLYLSPYYMLEAKQIKVGTFFFLPWLTYLNLILTTDTITGHFLANNYSVESVELQLCVTILRFLLFFNIISILNQNIKHEKRPMNIIVTIYMSSLFLTYERSLKKAFFRKNYAQSAAQTQRWLRRRCCSSASPPAGVAPCAGPSARGALPLLQALDLVINIDRSVRKGALITEPSSA